MGRLLPQDADAYDRYSIRGPLPPSRNRDVPPDKYLVPYCVRENEGNAQYSCPHLGCDGLGFHTARECHTHEDRYHAGPYRCGTCERLFATQSALERHCTETGHRIWVCRMSGCDMEGVCFGDGHEFEKHVRESRAHEGLKVDEALAGNDEDALSECSAVGKMCLAQACHKFEKFFASPAEWEKHAASRGHVRAISLFESFCQLDISADELAAKLEAARGLRCDKSDCRRFGAAMSSTQVFFHHLETEGHKDPEGLRAKEAEKRVRMVCEEPECARFGSEYRPAAFVKHVEGVSHINAVRMGEALRQLALLPPSTPGPAAERASIVGLPTPTASLTEGPFPARPARFTTPTRRIVLRRSEQSGGLLVSPGSPDAGLPSPALTEQEMWLEMRNRVLEDEVRILREVVRKMSER